MVSLFEVGRGGYLALGCYFKNVLTERYASDVDVYSYQITTILRGFVEKIIQLNYFFEFIMEVGVICYIL